MTLNAEGLYEANLGQVGMKVRPSCDDIYVTLLASIIGFRVIWITQRKMPCDCWH